MDAGFFLPVCSQLLDAAPTGRFLWVDSLLCIDNPPSMRASATPQRRRP